MEPGILVLEIQNSTNDWNLQSNSHWQNDPESTECNPESKTGLDSTVIGGQSAANFLVSWKWQKSVMCLFPTKFIYRGVNKRW